jgi:hypothetical protein
MFKKLLVLACVALFLTVGVGSVMANGVEFGPPGWYERTKTNGGIQKQYFPKGNPINQSEWTFIGGECGDCGQVTDSATPNVGVHQAITAPGSDGMNGGKAVGDFYVGGSASATGKDSTKWGWVGPKWYNYGWKFVAGEATAYGAVSPTMSSSVDIFTNGEQINDGPLSYSFVKSSSQLHIDGEVWAKGNEGCGQSAIIDTDGSLGAFAYGGSNVEHSNGISYAQSNGWGQTDVSFYGYESDFSTHGFLFWSNKAEVDFNSFVNVEQSILNISYVSPDGATAGNFAYVGGGSAELNLGSDGWFGQDNINLTGIQATGSVAQNAMATNGVGAFAYGGSSAYFSGAVGNVNSTIGWCGPDQTANVGGYALVGGYNNVSTSPGSLTVTSVQFGHATTGNSGLVD